MIDAHWIHLNTTKSPKFICSLCFETAYYYQDVTTKFNKEKMPYKFCPNCGKKISWFGWSSEGGYCKNKDQWNELIERFNTMQNQKESKKIYRMEIEFTDEQLENIWEYQKLKGIESVQEAVTDAIVSCLKDHNSKR